MLSAGGAFLTQQVHGMWMWDLQAAFDVKPLMPDNMEAKYTPMLEAAGMAVVTVEEWEGRIVFTDVGAVVYYLKPFPGWSPGSR